MQKDKAELIVIKHLIQTQDVKMLGSINVNWFSPAGQHIIMILQSNTRNLSRVYLEVELSKLPDKAKEDLKSTFVSQDKLFEPIDLTYKPSEACKLLETRHIQERMNSELLDIQKIIFDEEPAKIILRIVEYFNKIPTGLSKARRISSNLTKTNETLITLSTTRPLLQKTIPAKKNLMVIGGDSGMQKTNQALCILIDAVKANIISDPNFKAVFFSKEMDWDEARDRILAIVLDIPFDDVTNRKGKFDLGKTNELLAGDLRWVDENFVLVAPEEFNTEADIIRFITENSATVWALDFVQLFAQVGAGNKLMEMNPLVMKTIAFAKICVQLTNTYGILLSQVRKKDERRLTHFPRMDDLEWSGAIKHLAHVVMMVFWPYRIKQEESIMHVFISSYQKVRKNNMASEFQISNPANCSFKPMDTRQAELYKKYLDM